MCALDLNELFSQYRGLVVLADVYGRTSIWYLLQSALLLSPIIDKKAIRNCHILDTKYNACIFAHAIDYV